MPIPSFLDRESEVKIPVGGGIFLSGFLAEWRAGVYNKFFSETKLPQEEYKYDDWVPKGGGWWYYFRDYVAALAAAEDAGVSGRPRATWRFTAPTTSVLNFADQSAAEKFGPMLKAECLVTTYRSKYRHELHMIALPSAVAAMAKFLGYDNPGFDLKELLDPNTLYTVEFEQKMIGDPNSDTFSDSVLWKRRQALWQALGETNPRAYQMKGKGTTFDTQSEKLSDCLSILGCPWTSPIWARVVYVNDPRLDATFPDANGNPQRLSRPALTSIFEDKAAAEKIAQTERLAREEASTGVAPVVPAKEAEVPAVTASGLVLPDAWAGLEADWQTEVDKFKAEYAGKPKPVVARALQNRAADLMATLAVTPDDVLAWLYPA